MCWFGHSFHLTKFEHFKFSNLKKWQVRTRFSTIKWFQLKKWWIPKLYNSSRSTTFILIISSSDKVIVNIIHKSTCFSYSSWNYESYVNLWTMFTNTLSHEEVTKIKVVDSDEFNNFYVHDFYSWNHLKFQNLVWSCHLLKFKISTILI